MNENGGCFFCALVVVWALWTCGANYLGQQTGREQSNTEWREYLIERDMAHWSVDPATGEVSFVLEEPEHDAERSD